MSASSASSGSTHGLPAGSEHARAGTVPPRHGARSSRIRAGVALAALVLTGVGLITVQTPSARAALPSKPDVVVILTDDQRWDDMWPLAVVRERIIGPGADFSDAFVVNPLCCPSRASILTGNYSHTHGVYNNAPPHGGFPTFRGTGADRATIATALDDAGYRTALVGKYMNGYTKDPTYLPPGWDSWAVFSGGEGRYYNYALSVSQGGAEPVLVSYGADPGDYSTDVLRDRAVGFIESTPADRPLFLVYAPWAPHNVPIPAPRHAAFDVQVRAPSFNEHDVSDKPGYIRKLKKVNGARMDELRGAALGTLLAVDEAVEEITDALRRRGTLERALLIFASDNGLAFGEHRWRVKRTPYEESIRIPLAIRYDPLVQAGSQVHSFALNIDLAPTIAEIADVPPPPTDGRSLVPLLTGERQRIRSRFLIERMDMGQGDRTPAQPAYCAVRNRRFTYVRYRSGFEELYDLLRDPHQLDNRAREMRRKTAKLRAVTRRLCDPLPPDMDPF